MKGSFRVEEQHTLALLLGERQTEASPRCSLIPSARTSVSNVVVLVLDASLQIQPLQLLFAAAVRIMLWRAGSCPTASRRGRCGEQWGMQACPRASAQEGLRGVPSSRDCSGLRWFLSRSSLTPTSMTTIWHRLPLADIGTTSWPLVLLREGR
jgi:hypothetical protein